MGGAGPAEFLGLQEGRDHLRQRRECLPHSLGLEDPWAEGEGDVSREGIVPLGSQRSKLGRKKKGIRGLSPSCS